VRRYSQQTSLEEQQNEIDRAIAEGSFLIDSLEEGGVAPAPVQVAPTLEESATAATSPIGEVETDVEVDETSTFVEDPAQGTLDLPEPKPKPKRKVKGKTTPEVKSEETKGKLGTTLELDEKGLPKTTQPKPRTATRTTRPKMTVRSAAEIAELNRKGREQAAALSAGASEEVVNQTTDTSEQTDAPTPEELATADGFGGPDVSQSQIARAEADQKLNEARVKNDQGQTLDSDEEIILVAGEEDKKLTSQERLAAAAGIDLPAAKTETTEIIGDVSEEKKKLIEAYKQGALTKEQANRAEELGLRVPRNDNGDIVYPTPEQIDAAKKTRIAFGS
jgi:hypothetical protein